MILDTSVLLCLLLGEPDRERYAEALIGSTLKTSAGCFVEVGLKLISQGVPDAAAFLTEYLEGLQVEVVPIDVEQAKAAVQARERFGKGRHPAGLNYGDCFAYALAKVTGEPLLYKGDDFARTDVVSAL